MDFIVGGASGNSYSPCDYIMDPAKHYYSGRVTVFGMGTGSIAGYNGRVSPTVTISGDGLTITAAYSHPGAGRAGLPVRCAVVVNLRAFHG